MATGVGDSDLGLELLEEAVQKHPDHPLNHLFYAYALRCSRRWRRATKQLEIGLEKLEDPRFSEAAPYWKKEAISLAKELKIPLRIELPSPFRRQISVLKLNLKDKFGKLMTHAINAAVVAIGTVRVNLTTFFALACPEQYSLKLQSLSKLQVLVE